MSRSVPAPAARRRLAAQCPASPRSSLAPGCAVSGAPRARAAGNAALEFDRNRERYQLLRWGQSAFRDFRVVPPDTGIVHQVNLEFLASTVFTRTDAATGETLAYPDTCVGTDSHTSMVNSLGVVGWGVGGKGAGGDRRVVHLAFSAAQTFKPCLSGCVTNPC